MLTSTAVRAVEDTGSGVKVTVRPAKGGEQRVLEADKMLQAMGFAPRIAGYGIDKTGVALTDRGAIAIDDYCRTNVAGIYAIGDVTGKMMLAHTAGLRAWSPPDDRGRRDHACQLRDDPARHLLPAADRLVRAVRAAQAKDAGYEGQGGQVPVLRQRQGKRHG